MPSFPSSPVPNQEYTENGVTYIYANTKWKQANAKTSSRGSSIVESGNTAVIDLTQGNFFDLTYDSSTVVSFSNPPASGSTQTFKVLVNSPASEGFSLSNASYDNISSLFIVSASSYSLSFKTDGKYVYVLDNTNDRIVQYTLSTPWRVDTIDSTTLKIFSVSSQETNPTALFFDPTGTNLYVVGTNIRNVVRYVLSAPWDISTAVYSSQAVSVASQETSPFGLSFKSDGTKMYVSGNVSDTLYQYNLPTPWVLTGATYDNKFLIVSAQDTNPRSHQFNTDGTKLYIPGASTNRVYQYNLTIPWDVSTAIYSGILFNPTSQDSALTGIYFKPEGDKMYTFGNFNGRIYQYSTVATTATVTWPASVIWQEGQAPVLTPGKSHMIEFYTSDGGTSYYASPAERDI